MLDLMSCHLTLVNMIRSQQRNSTILFPSGTRIPVCAFMHTLRHATYTFRYYFNPRMRKIKTIQYLQNHFLVVATHLLHFHLKLLHITQVLLLKFSIFPTFSSSPTHTFQNRLDSFLYHTASLKPDFAL